jgi:hypothetical protein
VRAKTPLAIERVELVRPGFQAAVIEEHNWGERPFGTNVAETDTFQFATPLDLELTQPYWLRHVSTGAWNEVADPIIVGTPENFPALAVRYWLTANGEHFQASVPVTYRWVDPVAGERYRALDVVPPVSLALDRDVFLFPDRAARPVDVTVKSGDTRVAGDLKLELPGGWSATPASMPMIRNPGQPDTVARFQVRPPAGASTGTLLAYLEDASGRRYSRQLVRLDYPHIPMQTLIPQAEARLVRADLQARGREVGYVMGSGDPIPGALEQMGFHVTRLDDRDLERGDLSRYPVIVIGVRAYNTRPRLRALQPRLLDWVAKGGALVVQYVTTADGPVDYLGPLPFRVSRDRVTVEDAPVSFLKPTHRLLNAPNKLTASDFDSWVQERGLYFANPYDPNYDVVLGSHDPGEPSRAGGLLYAKHGSGEFVYCGYALFRQVPAGVPGAWRLLANLVSGSRVRYP